MADRSSFDLSNRVFTLLAVFTLGMSLFWVFRMVEIWTTVSGGYAREISVDAEGSAYIVPDTAVINLGVMTEGETSEAVVEQNTTTMEAVMAAIEGLGVEKDDIKTTGYYLSPKYNWTDEGSEQDGYTLTQSLEVRLSDFELIGKLVSATTTAGANQFNGVNFEVDDPEMAKADARAEAIAQAKEKAEQIAEQSGLKLGKMVNYYEYSSSYGKGGVYPESTLMDSAESAANITPGEEEISLTVTLTYQIR